MERTMERSCMTVNMFAVVAGVWGAVAGCALKITLGGVDAIVIDTGDSNSCSSSSSMMMEIASEEEIGNILGERTVAVLDSFLLLSNLNVTSSILQSLLAHDYEWELFGHNLSLVNILLRAFCGVLFLVSNSKMWVAFSQALDASPSTVAPTIVNFVSNSVFSIILGLLVFGEVLTFWDILASICMCAGVIIIVSESTVKKNASIKSKHQQLVVE
eukprot:m.140265 g.140265  ORF g.140265 m.140265 type:complete len:215 (-) comp28547_c0_seq1:318-962(-)